MTYIEYFTCAEKHLKGCSQLLLSYQQGTKYDNHVWLELYYLSGYIIEGIVVYSAYKLHNWNSSVDIRNCDLSFTKRTNLDFYYKRPRPSFFQNRPAGALSVQGHKFQEIAKSLLKPDPSFNDVPYIGNGQIDSDVERLIDDWKPEVRYQYHGMAGLPTLNQNIIDRLLSTCFTIYSKHI
ncbi:MAG: hypothetical protein IJ845_06255 [Bacteroidaceae bacterium]|nr:hypothetical protein [Bacteroidaceae bacterium]